MLFYYLNDTVTYFSYAVFIKMYPIFRNILKNMRLQKGIKVVDFHVLGFKPVGYGLVVFDDVLLPAIGVVGRGGCGCGKNYFAPVCFIRAYTRFISAR